jgi:transcription elongation factor GreB
VGSIPASRTKQKPAAKSCGFFHLSLAFLHGIRQHRHMSKAFTRESDRDDDEEPLPDQQTPGGKNYITRAGYERLRAELFSLIDEERPRIVEIVHWAASNGDRSENGDYLYGKKRLREIDRRIRFLTRRLEIAEVVDASVHHGSDQVFFGATVVYADPRGKETEVTILGVDEADTAQGQISWVSPVARALLRAREGDLVKLMLPEGAQPLEVLSVTYPRPSGG